MRRVGLCALMLAVVAVWGWTFSLMKAPVAEYGVVAFLAVRFAIAAAAMGLVTARRATRRSLATGGLIGLVLAAAYLLQTFGLRLSTATNTGLITGLFVVFVPLANRALFGVRTRAAHWLAIGASLVGLALLTGAGRGRPALGDALTLGCAACFGLHVALLDRHAKHHDAGVLAFGQIGSTAVVLVVLWPLVGRVSWPSPRVWFALVVTALVATALAFTVQTFVQQRLSAVATAVIIVTEPVFAALFGYLVAGDRLAALQWLGAALMVGALAVADVYPTLRRARRRVQPAARAPEGAP